MRDRIGTEPFEARHHCHWLERISDQWLSAVIRDRRAPLLAPDQPRDFVSPSKQRRHERSPDCTARPGYKNPHFGPPRMLCPRWSALRVPTPQPRSSLGIGLRETVGDEA